MYHPKQAYAAASNHRGRKVMWAGDDVGHDFGFRGVGHGRLKNADDRGAARAEIPAAEADGLAHHRGVFLEDSGPEMIGEHDDAGRVGPVILGADQASEHRAQAHDFKISATDDAGDAASETASARALGDISREMRALASSYRPALFRPAEVARRRGGVVRPAVTADPATPSVEARPAAAHRRPRADPRPEPAQAEGAGRRRAAPAPEARRAPAPAPRRAFRLRISR